MNSRSEDNRFKKAVAEHERTGMGRVAALNAAVVQLRAEDASARRVQMSERGISPREQASKASFDSIVESGMASGLDRTAALNAAVVQCRALDNVRPLNAQMRDSSRKSEAARFDAYFSAFQAEGMSANVARERAVVACKAGDAAMTFGRQVRDLKAVALADRGMGIDAALAEADRLFWRELSAGVYQGKQLVTCGTTPRPAA